MEKDDDEIQENDKCAICEMTGIAPGIHPSSGGTPGVMLVNEGDDPSAWRTLRLCHYHQVELLRLAGGRVRRIPPPDEPTQKPRKCQNRACGQPAKWSFKAHIALDGMYVPFVACDAHRATMFAALSAIPTVDGVEEEEIHGPRN